MLRADGDERLKGFTATAYPPTVTEVVPDTVFHVLGMGHSNASFIIADESVILIDTLDTDVRGAKLQQMITQRTAKPVKTIIYTHGHPDHLGGAGAFAPSDPEIIAYASARPALSRSDRLGTILEQRGTRQFGYTLTTEEAISQGYGIREGFTIGEGVRRPLPPTTVYRNEMVDREIDGVRLVLDAAPGESEDQCLIWLEAHQVLFCGDTYCGCWPNLYAIRGGPYRDVATWIASLDLLRHYPAEALLPGHTRPVIGRDAVAEVLTNYRNALDYVLTETLACMDRGMGLEQTVDAVQLPDELSQLPYLGEYYGTVAWSVRSIYTGYLGWFDGNPTHLNPLSPYQRAENTIAMMGGQERVTAAVRAALDAGESQWALELVDLLLTLDPDNAALRRAKARGLLALGQQETSANGRHYYLAYAKELFDDPS